MYIPQPVKINLKDGVVETAGGIRKITVVFMELLDVEIAVSDDKDTLDQACFHRCLCDPCFWFCCSCSDLSFENTGSPLDSFVCARARYLELAPTMRHTYHASISLSPVKSALLHSAMTQTVGLDRFGCGDR